MGKVLVVAFDGLDKELIDEFNLESIKQEEFGLIDNKTQIKKIKTSELFASFITGQTHEIHGLTGLGYQGKKEFLVSKLFPDLLLDNVRGTTRLRNAFQVLVNSSKRRYNKNDMTIPTLFDEIENSKAMFVPSWNPSCFWTCPDLTFGLQISKHDYEERERSFYWDEFEYERRKKKLFRPVNKWYDFLMCHFHRPDVHHHLYADENLSSTNMSKIEKTYKETDELAKQIVSFFEEDYEYIIFMSDHGLPTKNEHNENAFYSCNKELFGEEVPHITGFHDAILKLTNK